MDKIKKIFPYIIILALIWSNTQTIKRVEQLDSSIKSVEHEMNNISNKVGGIRNMIQEDLDENNVLNNFIYLVSEPEDGDVVVSVEIDLNQLSKDSSVRLSYKEVDPNVGYDDITLNLPESPSYMSKEIDLQSDDLLSYTGEFKANMMFSYDMKLIIENDKVIHSVDLGDANFYERFYPHVEIDIEPYRMDHTGFVSYHCYLDLFNLEDLTVTSAICKMKYKNETYDSFDLLELGERDQYADDLAIEYAFERQARIKLGDDEEIDFKEVTLEMLVTTDANITYHYRWPEH